MGVRGRVGAAFGRRATSAACALAFVLSGCASSVVVNSSTPRLSLDPASSGSTLLLSQDDVRAVAGFGKVVARDLDKAPIFEDPDPRGPCGGHTPAPPVGGAAGRAFTTSNLGIVQLVVTASAPAEQYFAALTADRVTPCGPYTSTTNTGATQTVSEITFVDLTSPASEAIAWTGRVEVGKSSAYIGIGAVLTGGHLALVQAQSVARFDPAALQALVERAGAKIKG